MQCAAQLQYANQNLKNRDNFICHTTSVIKFMESVMKRPEQNYRGLLCGKRYKSYDHGTVAPVGEYLLADLILYIVLPAHTYSRQFIAIHLT